MRDDIIVISGTNRQGSYSRIVSEIIYRDLKDRHGLNSSLLDLADLESAPLMNGAFTAESQHSIVRDVQERLLIPSKAFYFVIPEYNGSFPGFLKYFIDACSLFNRHGTFSGKKAAIIGISSGRAGNLRGMEHLTGILHYLNVTVMLNRLPISRIQELLDKQQPDKASTELLKSHVDEFIAFCK